MRKQYIVPVQGIESLADSLYKMSEQDTMKAITGVGKIIEEVAALPLVSAALGGGMPERGLGLDATDDNDENPLDAQRKENEKKTGV